MDSIKQGLYSSSGVILRRSIHGEGNIGIYVFLKRMGPMWINAPGSARGRVRFGGATEPMTWGVFHIYKGPRSCYLKSVEVKNDLWSIRKNHILLKTCLKWLKLLSGNLLEAHPDDKLLGILYWSFELLQKEAEPEMVNWRFLWRWLNLWGIAPDLSICPGCGNTLSNAVWQTEAYYCPSCVAVSNGNAVSNGTMKLLDLAARSSHRMILEGNASFARIDPDIWRINSSRLIEALARSR